MKRLTLLVLAVLWTAAAGAQAVLPLQNGGFEQNTALWRVEGNFFPGSFSKAHGGTKFAYFGVWADGRTVIPNASGSLSQIVKVPAVPANLGLLVWRWITSDETDSLVHDKLTIEILDLSGKVLETRVLSNLDKTAGYVREAIPVAKYANTSVRVQFRGQVDRSKATVFRIDDVALTQLPNPTVNFSGIVSDVNTKSPIVKARVEWGLYSAITGSDGRYSFANVACQVATLRVTADGYQTVEQPLYAPSCYGDVNVRNISMTPRTTTLSGIVRDKWTGLPIPNVTIRFGTLTVPTASNGVYGLTLPNCLPALLSATVARFKPAVPASYTPVCRAENVKNFDLVPEVTTFTVRTNRDAEVTWGGQKPLVQNDGVYVFAGFPCGTALLEIKLTGFETVKKPYTPICDESVWETIDLVPKLARFTGVVTVAGSATPIANALVDWKGIQIRTDPNGRYTFWNVPCESATLTVTAEPYRPSRQPYAPRCDAENQKNIALVPAPTGYTTLCGVVLDAKKGTGIANATVTHGVMSAITDENGSYCLSRLACKSDMLSISAPPLYEPFSKAVIPSCGKRIERFDTLDPIGFSGRVEDDAGGVLAGVNVQWGNIAATVTGRDGRYTFLGCGEGPVIINKAGYESYQYNAVTCKVGVGTAFRYVHLRPAASTANIFIRTFYGGFVEWNSRVATPGQTGYWLWAVPCSTASTLNVSVPLYLTSRTPYMPLCGITNVKDVPLLQVRTYVSGVVIRGPNRVSGARVTWGASSTVTNEHGNFGFENIACGITDTLTVTKDGFYPKTLTITTSCTSGNGATIDLIPIPTK